MRIGSRLNLLIATALLVLAVITVVALSMLRTSILHEKEEKLQGLVELGLTTLDYYGKQVESGTLTKEAAQVAAKRTISALRYEGDNYLFVVDTAYRMLVQPLKPEMEGKDVSEVKDVNGVRVIYELVELAKRDGWNYLGYHWPKPGVPEPVDKLSTARLYAPWGWVLGTGIYIDDVDQTFWGVALVLWDRRRRRHPAAGAVTLHRSFHRASDRSRGRGRQSARRG